MEVDEFTHEKSRKTNSKRDEKRSKDQDKKAKDSTEGAHEDAATKIRFDEEQQETIEPEPNTSKPRKRKREEDGVALKKEGKKKKKRDRSQVRDPSDSSKLEDEHSSVQQHTTGKTTVQVEEAEDHGKMRKKRRNRESAVDVERSGKDEGVEVVKKKGSRRDLDHASDAEETHYSIEKKKKKRRIPEDDVSNKPREGDGTVDEETPDRQEDTIIVKKKTSKRKLDEVSGILPLTEKKEKKRVKSEGDDASKKGHKSSKSKHHRSSKKGSDIPNPKEDSSLSDQAAKALCYVYTQIEDPSSWKFNKARQNWLIRNVWSDEAIPDKYLSLLMGYLAKTQGGVRDNLIKVCENTISPSVPISASVEPALKSILKTTQSASDTDTAGTGVALAVDSVKLVRAKAILDVLSPQRPD